jgi:hypothetical protein
LLAGHQGRPDLLLAHADEMDDRAYWKAVADTWQDSERPRLGKRDWQRLFYAKRPRREELMSPEERAELAALPERIPVFCGVGLHNFNVHGLSWTLDRDRAAWFARRFANLAGAPGVVVAGTTARARTWGWSAAPAPFRPAGGRDRNGFSLGQRGVAGARKVLRSRFPKRWAACARRPRLGPAPPPGAPRSWRRG